MNSAKVVGTPDDPRVPDHLHPCGDLQGEIDDMKALAKSRAIWNWRMAAVMLWIAGLTGVASPVLVAAQPEIPGWLAVLVATIASGAFTIMHLFQFHTKSLWWWKRFHRLCNLTRKLRDEGLACDAVSRELQRYVIEAEGSYPGFSLNQLARNGEVRTQGGGDTKAEN